MKKCKKLKKVMMCFFCIGLLILVACGINVSEKRTRATEYHNYVKCINFDSNNHRVHVDLFGSSFTIDFNDEFVALDKINAFLGNLL